MTEVGAGSAAHLGVPDSLYSDDVALLDEVDAELGGVDAALRRLDEGTYFTCDVCGTGLDPAVMERYPLTTVCSAHAR